MKPPFFFFFYTKDDEVALRDEALGEASLFLNDGIGAGCVYHCHL
jgi:hypothetical protein